MGANSKQRTGTSEEIISDTGKKHKRPGKRGIWVGLLATLLILAGAGLVTHEVSAISNIGPDSAEYGTEAIWYTLSNTQYVNSTVMSVPLYSPTKPIANVLVTITTSPDGGANGNITVEGVAISNAPSTTKVISEPAASFALDANTGYYKAILNATIGGAQADDNYKLFRMSVTGSRVIGYSSLAPNTDHFAVGGQNRCDPGGDSSGCGNYYNWQLPFAPACSQASGNATIQLFDADNVDPGAGTIFGNFGVQPSPFQVRVWDTTVSPAVAVTGLIDPTTSPGNWGNSQSKSITFAFQQYHKYEVHLFHVYANNVIQFKLPFDSINTLVSCPTGGITSSVVATCTTLKGYMYDKSDPTLAMTYYVFVNPPPGTPDKYVNRGSAPPANPDGFRGPGNANLANPPGTPPGVPAGHSFSNTIAGLSTYNYNGEWAPNTYWVYARSAGFANLTVVGKITGPVCGSVTCTPLDTSFSGSIGLGAPVVFNVRATVNGATTLPPGASFAVSIKDSGGTVVQSYTPAVASPPPGVLPGPVTSANMTFSPPGPGTYSANWSYNGVNCTGPPVSAVFQPYFEVTGGDVASGLTNDTNAGATACTQLNSSSAAGQAAIIKSWNYDGNSPGTRYGAGTVDGALALGQISSFVTGINSLAIPTAASALQSTMTGGNGATASFANSSPAASVAVTPATGSYGGGWNQFGYCAKDYVGLALARTSAVAQAGSSFDITGKSGTYKFAGDVTLTGTLSSDQWLTIVTPGNVYISNDMGYPGAATVDDIPYFEVLAGSSIFVDHGVGNLYGFYDAQGGTFATCATAIGAETTLYDTCNSPLTIEGMVSASSIHFDRTYGNLKPVAGVVGSGTPSEIIRYSPTVWLGALNECTADPALCPSGGYPYDSITSLPPVL